MDTYASHVKILAESYGEVVQGVPSPINGSKFLAQMSAFKYAMCSEHGVCQGVLGTAEAALAAASSVTQESSVRSNMFSIMWSRIHSNPNMSQSISEIELLAQVYAALPVGSVDDERAFSAMSHLKNERRNGLSVHLPTTMRMYCQNIFDIDTFPLQEAFDAWRHPPDGEVQQRYNIGL